MRPRPSECSGGEAARFPCRPPAPRHGVPDAAGRAASGVSTQPCACPSKAAPPGLAFCSRHRRSPGGGRRQPLATPGRRADSPASGHPLAPELERRVPLAPQPQPPAGRLSRTGSIKRLPDGTQPTARPRVLKPYPESPRRAPILHGVPLCVPRVSGLTGLRTSENPSSSRCRRSRWPAWRALSHPRLEPSFPCCVPPRTFRSSQPTAQPLQSRICPSGWLPAGAAPHAAAGDHFRNWDVPCPWMTRAPGTRFPWVRTLSTHSSDRCAPQGQHPI